MNWLALRFVAAVVSTMLAPRAALATDGQIWVVLQGPNVQLPQARPDYTLEIGRLGWRVDGKNFDAPGLSAVVPSTVPLLVRVRRLSDCAPSSRSSPNPGPIG